MRKFLLLWMLLFCKLNSVIKLPWINSKALLKCAFSFVPENSVILEAGSFDGLETVEMKRLWPNSTIHTFEPVPMLFEKVKQNTKSYENIFCYDYALGDSIGTKIFYLSEDPNYPNIVSQSSSLLPPKYHSQYGNNTFDKKIEVDVITIDAWAKKFKVEKLDFLWLDLQGYELQALKSAGILLNNVSVIVTEVEQVEAYENQYLYKDLKRWLHENGFRLVAKNFNNQWCGDAIFINVTKYDNYIRLKNEIDRNKIVLNLRYTSEEIIADINRPLNTGGDTIAILAAKNNLNFMLNLLVEHNSNLTQKNTANECALDFIK